MINTTVAGPAILVESLHTHTAITITQSHQLVCDTKTDKSGSISSSRLRQMAIEID